MDTSITKANQAEAIGKMVVANQEVQFHSTPSISPTGFGAGAYATIGKLESFEQASDGNLWMRFSDGDSTFYVLFMEGVFQVAPETATTRLKFLKNPVISFAFITFGLLVFGGLAVVIIFNTVRKKSPKA